MTYVGGVGLAGQTGLSGRFSSFHRVLICCWSSMERLYCTLGWGQLGTTWRVQCEDCME